MTGGGARFETSAPAERGYLFDACPVAFDTLESYAKGEDVPLQISNVDRVFDIENAAEYLPEAY